MTIPRFDEMLDAAQAPRAHYGPYARWLDAQPLQLMRERREQAGSGQRGDKIRTIALQRDQVTDHRTGRSCSAREYLRGKLRLLIDLPLGK